MTIGELKRFVADLPDDAPVSVRSGSTESFVAFDIEYYTFGDEFDDQDGLIIFAEH